jgi:CII-binding regulator of phage lambda lysogenization HflD
MAAKPGLRKDALELARTLIARSTQTLVLTGHDAMGDPSGWPKQAQTSNAQLVSDYNNIYANQVQSLRQRFILQGQKNWQNDRYYENPTTARDIQHLGFELLTHATALN